MYPGWGDGHRPRRNRRLHTHGSRTPPRVAHHTRSGRVSDDRPALTPRRPRRPHTSSPHDYLAVHRAPQMTKFLSAIAYRMRLWLRSPNPVWQGVSKRSNDLTLSYLSGGGQTYRSLKTSRVRAGVFRWLGSVKPSVPPPGTMLCYVRGRRQGRGSVREGVAAAAAKFRTSSTRIRATTPTQLMESEALCKQGCRCEVGAQEEQQLRR